MPHWLSGILKAHAPAPNGRPTLARLLLSWRHRSKSLPLRYPRAATSGYYQHVHNSNDAYKQNNWLISEIDNILSIRPKSILEIGCGNGRFLAAVRDRVENVTGIDWAESPVLAQLGLSNNFKLADISKTEDIPEADLVCSADVLEHIAPDHLMITLERIHRAGPNQYHVIACYDDGHSHLSIMEPHAWLHAFAAISDKYRIIDVRLRRNDPMQPICVIATFNPEPHE